MEVLIAIIVLDLIAVVAIMYYGVKTHAVGEIAADSSAVTNLQGAIQEREDARQQAIEAEKAAEEDRIRAEEEAAQAAEEARIRAEEEAKAQAEAEERARAEAEAQAAEVVEEAVAETVAEPEPTPEPVAAQATDTRPATEGEKSIGLGDADEREKRRQAALARKAARAAKKQQG